MGFAGAGAQDNPTVKDDLYPMGSVAGSVAKSIHQVGFGIGDFQIDGLLAAGKNDRLWAVLNQIAERRGSIGHGIGSVGQYKAVVRLVMPANGRGHLLPVGWSDIGTVQIAELNAVHLAEGGDLRAVTKDLLSGKLRGKTALGDFGGDGAAGTDHQNLFHGKPLFRISFLSAYQYIVKRRRCPHGNTKFAIRNLCIMLKNRDGR